MLGEIRDLDTAEIAARAALTGHFVLSTLHTNDTVATISRLIDIGLEPFLITSAVSGVIAQRLIRRICSGCKIETDPPENIDQYNLPPVPTFYKGTGCNKCNNTGYKGRIGVYELLKMDTKLKRIISKSFTEADLWKSALESGTRVMFEDAWEKIIEGETTFEEVLSKIPFQHIESKDSESRFADRDKQKILVFDNDMDEISKMRVALEGKGYNVVYSTNDNMLEETKREKPMLIIISKSEYRLNHIKEIRNMTQFAYTPIICLADKSYKKQEQEGFNLGINDILYRPLDVKKLLFSINRIIKTY